MPTTQPSSRPKEAKLFRDNRSQAVRIPAEYELPGDRVLIYREGNTLIIEPITKPTNIAALISVWRKESPLAEEERFPDIADVSPKPEDIF